VAARSAAVILESARLRGARSFRMLAGALLAVQPRARSPAGTEAGATRERVGRRAVAALQRLLTPAYGHALQLPTAAHPDRQWQQGECNEVAAARIVAACGTAAARLGRHAQALQTGLAGWAIYV